MQSCRPIKRPTSADRIESVRIFLTGCAGYVGSRLAGRLQHAGHRVVGLDRAALPGPVPLDDFIQCDLRDTDLYRGAIRDTDLICHLAAAKGDWGISDEEYERDNVHATRALIEAAKWAGCSRWIFYSTVSALGPSREPLSEDAPRRPANPYGLSKARCEKLFEDYLLDTRDARILNIRPSVIFGPAHPWNTNIFRLTDAVWRNRFIMIGKGDAIKTTSFIENLLDAHMFLMDREEELGSGMHSYHYVDEPALTTAELIAILSAELGKSRPKLMLPLGIASPLALVADALAALTGIDLPITSARIRKFCTATNFSAGKLHRLGYRQRFSNREALRISTQWYLETHGHDQGAARGARQEQGA
jgi:nucleoside-diphosphate-sugar epimerase